MISVFKLYNINVKTNLELLFIVIFMFINIIEKHYNNNNNIFSSADRMIQVGKIGFFPDEILGHGCEGTIVFK